jgi:hypothetical protein
MKKQEVETAQVKKQKPHPIVARILSMRDHIEHHLVRENRTLDEEFLLIIKKESKLPARHRDYILDYYNHMAQKQAQEQLNQKEETNENNQTQQPETENPTDVHHHGNDELHPGEES